MNWKVTGALLMAAAVGLGAFGAHQLRARLDEYSLSVFQTGVQYHFLHAIGILVVAAGLVPAPRAALVNWLFLAGIALFSGSLYVLALSGERWLGAVTPLGGVAFIAGWIVLAVRALEKQG